MKTVATTTTATTEGGIEEAVHVVCTTTDALCLRQEHDVPRRHHHHPHPCDPHPSPPDQHHLPHLHSTPPDQHHLHDSSPSDRVQDDQCHNVVSASPHHTPPPPTHLAEHHPTYVDPSQVQAASPSPTLFPPPPPSPQISLFNLLPEEVQHSIMWKLLPCDLFHVSLVDKYFCNLAQNAYTWRLLVEKTWDMSNLGPVPNNFDWKLYYREKKAFCFALLLLDWKEIKSPEPRPLPRQSHAATISGNKIIIIGGHQVIGESFQRQDDIWSFDPSTESFEQLHTNGTPVPAMSRHRTVTINDKIYSFGGILQNKKKLNSVFSLDPVTLTWEELVCHGTLPSPRCDPVVVAYRSDIVVFGGSVQDLEFPSDVHVFDTLTRTWRQPTLRGPLPPARIGCTGAVIGDTLYVYGGGDYDKVHKKYTTLFTEIWCLHLERWEWILIPARGDVPTIMDFLNAFVVGHHLVIEGGWYSEPYAFDTVSRRWTRMVNREKKIINNNDASATRIGKKVFYYGGYHNLYKHHLVALDIAHLAFLLDEDKKGV